MPVPLWCFFALYHVAQCPRTCYVRARYTGRGCYKLNKISVSEHHISNAQAPDVHRHRLAPPAAEPSDKVIHYDTVSRLSLLSLPDLSL